MIGWKLMTLLLFITRRGVSSWRMHLQFMRVRQPVWVTTLQGLHTKPQSMNYWFGTEIIKNSETGGRRNHLHLPQIIKTRAKLHEQLKYCYCCCRKLWRGGNVTFVSEVRIITMRLDNITPEVSSYFLSSCLLLFSVLALVSFVCKTTS